MGGGKKGTGKAKKGACVSALFLRRCRAAFAYLLRHAMPVLLALALPAVAPC